MREVKHGRRAVNVLCAVTNWSYRLHITKLLELAPYFVVIQWLARRRVAQGNLKCTLKLLHTEFVYRSFSKAGLNELT